MRNRTFVLALGTLPFVGACAYWQEGAPPKPAASEVHDSTPPAAVGTSAPSDSGATVVHMRGSNTVGASLAPKLAAAFLAHLGATDVATHDEKKDDNHASVTGTVAGKALDFEIDSPGSKVAFECLSDSSCDIGMASRPIQLDEAARLASLADMTSPAAEHVIGLDGIAVIVNRANRVNKLTVAQIDGLFEGKITNWSQVDGSPGEVHPYIRDKKSGTYDTFVQFVAKGRDLPTDRAKVLDNDGITGAIATDENGVGFVGLAYVNANKAIAVQDGEALPLAPTAFSVATEDYAFSRRLYLYTVPKRTAPLATQFVDFVISDDGQKVVAQTGFVGLNVTAAAASPTGQLPERYSRAILGGRRLSFNLRFRVNTSTPDGKATADIDRLARYIKATGSEVHAVELLGFADNQGDEAHNLELSRQRAKSIADELAKRGVSATTVEGFGSAMPIAPNDSADGRNKNRRVEVWVK